MKHLCNQEVILQNSFLSNVQLINHLLQVILKLTFILKNKSQIVKAYEQSTVKCF